MEHIGNKERTSNISTMFANTYALVESIIMCNAKHGSRMHGKSIVMSISCKSDHGKMGIEYVVDNNP